MSSIITRMLKLPPPLMRSRSSGIKAISGIHTNSVWPRSQLVLNSLRVLGSKVGRVRMAFILTTPVAIGSELISKTSTGTQRFLRHVDDLDATWKHEDEYQALQRQLSVDTDNPELLWRLARAIFQLSQRASLNQSQRRKLLEDALRCVHMSLKINDRDPNANVWCALITEAEVMNQSINQQIESAGIIRRHLDRALQDNPKNAQAEYCLAIWCYNLAKLSWIQRRIASCVCPSFPSSSWEESLQHFEKAEKLSPKTAGWRQLLVGAACCSHLGLTERAVSLLKRATSLPVRTCDDVKAQKEAKQLLKSLQG